MICTAKRPKAKGYWQIQKERAAVAAAAASGGGGSVDGETGRQHDPHRGGVREAIERARRMSINPATSTRASTTSEAGGGEDSGGDVRGPEEMSAEEAEAQRSMFLTSLNRRASVKKQQVEATMIQVPQFSTPTCVLSSAAGWHVRRCWVTW
jgi:hypothetical protein